MFTKLRNKVALEGSYLLFRYVADETLRERFKAVAKSGLKQQGLRDLTGAPARRRTLAGLK